MVGVEDKKDDSLLCRGKMRDCFAFLLCHELMVDEILINKDGFGVIKKELDKILKQHKDLTPKRRKSSKRETPTADKVVTVLSSAEKDTPLKKPTHIKKGENKDDPVDESPLRSIFCLKKIVDMKRVEETEDCFIHDFNPFNSVDVAKLSAANDGDVDEELSVVAERGQVACRDNPHSRHLCLQFPFDTPPHDRHSDLCYCYVCDSAALCEC
ncbi:caffeic acid 3-O-methyltransferase-like [Hibiscus syriacus]|uniref:Caffeic acid 3-O-methyltransferase-like n=1 Tax=Hibiscus syriacus TaxID=106335 RepID=A0A6A3CMT6_HIBSY|nr:caffeic acid 3-O-methyltransferase-like [Hibiscus syriacus]